MAKGVVSQAKKGKKRGGNKNKAKAQAAEEIQPKVARCRLLELPAELRNRIYHFAQEERFGYDIMPRTLSRWLEGKGRQSRYRTFLALSQTCKQIRQEYRPLWLRNHVLRLDVDDVRPYIDNFYSDPINYVHAPKLLLVSFDHRSPYGDDLLFDLSRLLELHAHRPEFTARFVCRKLADMDFWDHNCDECGHALQCGCGNDCDFYHELQLDDLMEAVEDSYEYLEAINNFLANDNEAWLKRLRDQEGMKLQVECAVHIECFPEEPARPTMYIRSQKAIYVRCLPEGPPPSHVYVRSPKRYHLTLIKAFAVLKRFGISDLKEYSKLDFVVREDTGKFTRPCAGCDYRVPTYEQVLIRGIASA